MDIMSAWLARTINKAGANPRIRRNTLSEVVLTPSSSDFISRRHSEDPYTMPAPQAKIATVQILVNHLRFKAPFSPKFSHMTPLGSSARLT